MSRKYMDLDTALSSKDPVFIRNNSLKANLMIVLEIKDKAGKSRPLRIPPTEAPICLTELFSRDVLRDSADLRLALTKGNLVLMEAKEAQTLLGTERMQDELKMLNMSVYADSAPSSQIADSMARVNKKAKKVLDKTAVLNKVDAKDPVNVRVRAIVGSYTTKEKNAKETLAQILRMKSILTKEDLSFIMRECSEDQNIRKFVETTLAELEAGPEQPFGG